VLSAIAALSGAGLLAVAKTDGRTSVYRMFQPPAGECEEPLEPNPNRSERRTGPKNGPVQKTDRTGPKNGPPLKVNSSRRLNLSGSTPGTTPPASDAGVCVRGVEEAVDAAHQAVFGAPMSQTWRRRLAGMDGSAVIFTTTTEADMRAALAKCQTLKRAWGFGWLEGVMLEKAADRTANRGGHADAEAETRRRKDAEEQRQRDAAESKAREQHWAGLDYKARSGWIRKAQNLPGPKLTRRLVEGVASVLAWRARQ
jgi:hypothetical protein